MSLKKKIFYSLNIGLFITGILLLYCSTLGSEDIMIRSVFGEIFIALSYILFPFIDMDKKEKLATSLGFHLIAFFIALFGGDFILMLYTKYPEGAVWWVEILAIFFMLYSISFICYTFICFFRAVYRLFIKNMAKNNNIESKYKSLKQIFEKITAIIVATSALLGSVTALIVAIKGILKGG